VPKFVGEVFNLVIFVIVFLVTLNVFYSIQIPHLIAGSGILAIILGLALQDTLGNILAGFALHFEKPYRAGDWLIVDNRHAQVMELNWRATRLRTNDDVYLDIPNSQLAKATIVNLSYPTSVHAMRLRVGLEYGTPPNDVKDALLHATAQAHGVLKAPAPKIFVVDFGDSAVVYEIKYWLSDHARFNEITDAVRTNVWYELNRRGLRIPFPIRTIQMAQGPTEAETEGTQILTRKVLRTRSLFGGFNDAQLDELLSVAQRGRYGRGEAIIEQGQQGSSMFVLLEGNADVLVAANGETTRVAGLGAGDCFGEMSLLNGEPRSATVLARTDCEVVEISKTSMAEMLERSPELLLSLSEMLARRRIENEGVLAESAHSRAITDKQRQYSATFLNRLKSFFDL
jgi:CRP-like cAMP-binding protein